MTLQKSDIAEGHTSNSSDLYLMDFAILILLLKSSVAISEDII